MTWNLPNILTVFRMLAAPGVALAFLIFARPLADWIAVIFFALASITDWLDGKLARAWGQESRFGAMLDPIADKAMVVIALCTLVSLHGLAFAVAFPTVFILMREVFVSGLREFLGTTAGLLKVTKLAKWKTTAQMFAIAILLAQLLFNHYFFMGTLGMDTPSVNGVLAGDIADPGVVKLSYHGSFWTYHVGIGLLWIAALLTVITGLDYLRKAMPFLREGGE